MSCGHSLKLEQCQKNKVIDMTHGQKKKTFSKLRVGVTVGFRPWEGLMKKYLEKWLIYHTKRLGPSSYNEKKEFSYNHKLHNKTQAGASGMNGMIFQRDWTPHMERFILTFCHRECWHHLNSAGILHSASWARFIFFHYFLLFVFWWNHKGAQKHLNVFLLLPWKSRWNHPQVLHLWEKKNFMIILQIGCNILAIFFLIYTFFTLFFIG